MRRENLDIYLDTPFEMKLYLRQNGYHFNKKMYDFAISKMYRTTKEGKKEKIEFPPKEKVQEILKRYGIQIENDELYDSTYVYAMMMSDFWGKSIKTEQDGAQWVKDVLDDADKPIGYVFNRFYADCNFSGIPIDWEEMT
ncbi:MAG: hypothetical protein J6Q61_09410 [Bacteroidales bacterium]|nr:hypothetical protein [Bacteroidales bacterium]